MKKITFSILSLLIEALLFNSCKKDDEPIIVNEDNITSIAKTIGTFNDDRFGDMTGNLKSTKCSCVEIINHENENNEFWPLSLTLDFGEENCEYPEGIFNRGKIHFSLTNHWEVEGAVKKVEFEDYYLNDINIFGTKTSTNTGYNEEQNLTWEIVIANAGIKDTLGNQKNWSATLYAEFIEGSLKDTKCHYSYRLTGSGQGTDNGIAYTAEITVPLVCEFRCWYPQSGEMTIKIGSETVIIDYGDGECDNKATMQIGDNEPEEITLGFDY